MVQVTGDGFFLGATNTSCRFGSRVAAATRETRRSLLCASPPAQEATHCIVEVAMNGMDYTASNSPVSYEYSDPQLLSISPNTITQPIGGALVAVTGTGLAGGTDYICKFGEAGTTAAVFNSGCGCAYCSAPVVGERNDTLLVPVEISLNGVDFTSSNSTWLMILPSPLGDDFLPATGPAAGGTIVHLRGLFVESDWVGGRPHHCLMAA
jgi:hypothetical protein